MSFIDIFPISLFYKKIKNIDVDLLKKYILDTEKSEESSNGSYTLENNILDNSIFFDLKNIILAESKIYLKEIGQCFDEIQISNSWGNILNNDQKINPHVHRNSHISGCFYLTEGSSINFLNPTLENFMFHNPPCNNLDTPRSWKECNITPFPGDLILFPSFLNHYVSPSLTNNRISLAFNIVPKGLIGNQTSKLYL
jgi:uncharacterized protein (TIGR02466 family)